MSADAAHDLLDKTPDELESLVRHHNALYWADNAPEIADADFDRLVRRLREVRPDSPVLSELGEPPPPLGSEVVHERPMLSLEKCYGDDDLAAFLETFDGGVVISPKFDGVACSLRYDERGRLFSAATRGTGTMGEDITRNIRNLATVPRTIPAAEAGKPFEVRGEVYMPLSIFEEFKERFSNPRNLTAGAIKQKDEDKARDYRLSFAAYDVLGLPHATEQEKIDFLNRASFAVVERFVVPKDEVLETYRAIAERRASLDFEIDGVVIKADRVSEQVRLGNTSHHPRYAIAYKFQGDTGTSVVRNLEWSVARTGAVTPVALIDPVMLSGAMVSRASLHHPGYLAKLSLTKEAQVEVTRRGGVIPNVERVTKPGPGEIPFEMPAGCPSCEAPLRPAGDFLYCDNVQGCEAIAVGKVAHFLSAIDVDGFGDRLLHELFVRGLVRTPPQLFQVTAADLVAIERVGKKLAEKVLGSLNQRRTVPLAAFLRSLGINELGKHASRILVDEFHTLERIRQVTIEELSAIHSIGDTIARAVVEGLAAEAPLIDALLLEMKPVEGSPETSSKLTAPTEAAPLGGRSFVFTGKMATLDRRSAQGRVVALGGTAPDSVNKHTTDLVVGDDKSDGKKSTKEKAAEKLVAAGAPLRIMSETDFLALVEGCEAKSAGV
jgi:DNA ligase (NAD+)